IVAAAERYLGCPYLWAGKSFFGIDCSGLVQNVFRDIGVVVPRDTDMQRDTIGETVTIAGETDLRRGDLLYMPRHVLIYAGGGEVIHASDGVMMVRRQLLAEFMAGRGFDFTSFVVRRHPAAAGGPADQLDGNSFIQCGAVSSRPHVQTPSCARRWSRTRLHA